MRLALASLLLASVAVSAAHAQTTPRSQDDVVITGKKTEPAKEAKRFVRQVMDLDDRQLARFAAPVCVEVAGLAPPLNQAIGERFRAVAEATAVPLAPAACEPNVLVLVVEDSDAFIKVARKKYRKRFAQLTDIDLRNALASGPVRSWRMIVTIDDMGRMVETTRVRLITNPRTDPVNEASVEGGVVPMANDAQTHAETVNAVIVIEKAATLGKSGIQIADYAAMRTLTGARPPKKRSIASPSILSLFDADGPAPAEISDMDLGLLGGLYALKNATGNADVELSRISRKMVSNAAPANKRD